MINQCKRFATDAQRLLLLVSCLLPLASCFLLLFGCAKKMLPPSPDRFAPRLLEIEPVNRIKIDLTFDENMNVSKLHNQSFTITATDGEKLKIRNLAFGNPIREGKTSSTITLFTEPTKPRQYFLSGTAEDRFGNILIIDNKKFKSSTFVDSFTPKITGVTPKIGTTKKYKNISIEFNFSEPIDTTRDVNFIVFPLDKNKIKWTWSNNWQNLFFGFPDSLTPNTIVYFILQPTLTDLENNRLENYGYTFFTTESILPPLFVSGTVYYNDKPHTNGVVILSNENSKAVTVSEIGGKFSVRLDTGLFNLSALADTNFDNKVDLLAELKNFNSEDTAAIKLNLEPVLESKEFDQYLR